MGKRHQASASDAWKQLALRFRWPEQRSYELIRPVVLFGDSAEERAHETGEPVRTLQTSPYHMSPIPGLCLAACLREPAGPRCSPDPCGVP